MDKWEVGVRGVAWIYVKAPSMPEAIRQAVASWNKRRHDVISSNDITSIAKVTGVKVNPKSNKDVNLVLTHGTKKDIKELKKLMKNPTWWTAKEERMYNHIKKSLLKKKYKLKDAKRIAAATVNKHHGK